MKCNIQYLWGPSFRSFLYIPNIWLTLLSSAIVVRLKTLFITSCSIKIKLLVIMTSSGIRARLALEVVPPQFVNVMKRRVKMLETIHEEDKELIIDPLLLMRNKNTLNITPLSSSSSNLTSCSFPNTSLSSHFLNLKE